METKQLTIDFTSDRSECSQCGEVFPAEDLNHYETCEECVDMLEAAADIRAEHSEKQLSRLPDDCKASYEWELIRPRKYSGWIPNSD